MSKIIHSPTLESAFVKKIENGQEEKMNEIEVFETESLKLPMMNQTQSSPCSEETFAFTILKRRKLETSKNESQYTYTKFPLPTSNLVERFF